MSETCSSGLILLGKVGRAHGLDGTLRVYSYAESAQSFIQAGRVALKKPDMPERFFQVASARPHKSIVLLRLDGLDSIDAAEDYRGAGVYIQREALVPQGEDEYFWYELIGMDVYLETGARIGTLKNILATGANDVYVVGTEKGETLIPAVHEVIAEIDPGKRKMIIRNMEGLLDLNEV